MPGIDLRRITPFRRGAAVRAALPLLLALPLAVSACSAARKPAVSRAAGADERLPPYVRNPPEPFARATAVAVAEREWRAFGSPVDDDPPDIKVIPREFRPDKQPGLWQRVADYWWAGQDAGTEESGWSSRYNENGTEYAGDAPAWSAAFVSYVMRTAGAGHRFPYTPLHADYVNAAARREGVLGIERLETYPPQPGDLVCMTRAGSRPLRFDDLPAPRFFGHCDIVVSAQPGTLRVIGGNVSGGVTMKHVPVTPAGTLAAPDGSVVDTRYPWFVVVRVRYDFPAAPPSS